MIKYTVDKRWKKTCYIKIKFECYHLTDVELNIYVDVDGLKTGEQNVQTDMLARRQEVQQPGVSAKSAKPEGVSHLISFYSL